MSNIIHCNRKHNHHAPEAVGYIPTPRTRIYVCDGCFLWAQMKCFYVLKFDQSDNEYSSDFEKNIMAKHVKLRGTQELKFKPQHKNGNLNGDTTITD